MHNVAVVVLGLEGHFWDPRSLEDFEKIVRPSDGRMLRVIATEQVLAVLEDLSHGPRTQGDLATRYFDGQSGKASEALRPVETLGIVARPGGRKQPYVLVHPEKTSTLLVAAAELAHALSSAQAATDAALVARRRRSSDVHAQDGASPV